MNAQILPILALLGHFASAAQCGAEAYSGAAQPGSCTGENLASAAQSGQGTSQCAPAINGACVDIVHEVGGGDCSVYTYDSNDCSGHFSDWLDCVDEGDALQRNFGSFNVYCSS